MGLGLRKCRRGMSFRDTPGHSGEPVFGIRRLTVGVSELSLEEVYLLL